jgi:hypothetical protein
MAGAGERCVAPWTGPVSPEEVAGGEGRSEGQHEEDGRRSSATEDADIEVGWQPVPLELPLDDPYRRPPVPAGGESNPDPDGDVGKHVIIIDLA